jgi:fibronectin type 3 domain-containing protein
VAAGAHTVQFVGLDPDGGDNTAFIANVQLNATTLPPAPTGLTATANLGQVVIAWNASPGAVSYTVYRGTVGDPASLVPIQTGVTSTSFTDTGLVGGATFFYAVKALNPASASPANPNGESAFSDLDSATVL